MFSRMALIGDPIYQHFFNGFQGPTEMYIYMGRQLVYEPALQSTGSSICGGADGGASCLHDLKNKKGFLGCIRMAS